MENTQFDVSRIWMVWLLPKFKSGTTSNGCREHLYISLPSSAPRAIIAPTKRPGRVDVDRLESFLGDPDHGGGAADLELVGNLPMFVGRHAHLFSYHAATRSVGLFKHRGYQKGVRHYFLPDSFRSLFILGSTI